MRRMKLNPTERVLVVSPVNRYKIKGPGRVWLTPRQRALATLYVGPRGQQITFDHVRSTEDIPLNITVQGLVKVEPEMFRADLLPKLPALNDGGWNGILRWRIEHILRKLIAVHPWQNLAGENTRERIERQLKQTLADRLGFVALSVLSINLVKIEIPSNLQETLIFAQQEQIEARARAKVLKHYLKIFGSNLPQVMPYIIQWELLNTVHKNNPQILLTGAGLSINGAVTEPALAINPVGANNSTPQYQMQLPLQ